jgi:hypothetical protein
MTAVPAISAIYIPQCLRGEILLFSHQRLSVPVVRFWFSDPRLSVLMRNKILFSDLGCSPRLRASVVRFCFFLISVYPRQSAVSF